MTDTATAILYSRPVRIEWSELRPGDQIDSTAQGWTGERVYDTVLKVVAGGHDQDESNELKDDDETYCEGDCSTVIFFEAEDCAYPMHVGRFHEVTARLRVELPA